VGGHNILIVAADEIPLLSMLICLFNDVGWGVLKVVKQAIVLPLSSSIPF
jgi:hypothetical protein